MINETTVQSVVLQTGSFDELQAAAIDWDQRYYQLSPGNFTGTLDLTQVGETQIMRERWNRKMRYQGTTPPRAFGFALPFQMPGPATWIGSTVCENTVVLQAPEQEADLVAPDSWDALVLSVPEDKVYAVAKALSERGDIGSTFHGAITLTNKVADQLRRMSQGILSQSDLCSFGAKEHMQRFSDQFVKMFLWEVIKAQKSSNFIKPDKPASIVRQATDLVLNDHTSGIGLTEICDQFGVSLRTLHYAFQESTGLSPATWLRRIRLNRVHLALLHASPEDTLVKQVALEHGFVHFGHFGEQYKRFFGCPPTQTLHS